VTSTDRAAEIEKLVDWLRDRDPYEGPLPSEMREALNKAFDLGVASVSNGNA
jgi:hypothetical protein